MKNAPDKIYLQVGDDEDFENVDFNELAEVTWCREQIFNTDLAYYRRIKKAKPPKNACPFCGLLDVSVEKKHGG